MNFRKPFCSPDVERSSGARSLGEMQPLHPMLRSVALFLVVALTLTGPVPQVALAANVVSLVQNSATGVTTSATGTVQAGSLVISPGTFSAITDSTFSLTPSVAGGTLSVQNLLFDGTYSLTIAVKSPATSSTSGTGTLFTVSSGSGTLSNGALVTLSSGLESGMSLSLGTLKLKNSSSNLAAGTVGFISAVNPTNFTVSQVAGGTVFVTSQANYTNLSGTLTATKAGLFDGVTADLSAISVLKLAAGGTLDLGKGLNVPVVGGVSGGILLAGTGANISVDTGVVGTGTLGSVLQPVRVDSGALPSRTLLNVSAGTGSSVFSEVYLSPGKNIDIIKNGGGILRLGTLDTEGVVVQGSGPLSAFSGALTVRGGTLQIGDSFLGVSVGAAAISANDFAVDSVSGLTVGMAVTGVGIAPGAIISAITSDYSFGPGVVTLDKAGSLASSSIIAGSLSSLTMSPNTSVALTGPTTFSSLNSSSITGGTHYLGVATTAGASYDLSSIASVFNVFNVSLTIDGTAASDFSGTILNELPSDYPGGRTLSLVKRGSGSLALRSDQNAFSGDLNGSLFLYAGSLIVSKSSSIVENIEAQTVGVRGPVGAGAMSLLGGTLFIDSGASTKLHNAVSLYAATDAGTFTRTVTFAGSAGSSLVLGTLGGEVGTSGTTFEPSSIYTDPISNITDGGSYASTLNLNVTMPVTFEGKLTGGPSMPNPATTVLIVKQGNETLTLASANAFVGDFRIDAGTVRLGSDYALGGGSNDMYSLTVRPGGVLDLSGTNADYTLAYLTTVLSLSGNGSSSGGFSSGALINSADANATYAGEVVLAGNTAIGGRGSITLSGSLYSAGTSNFTLTKLFVPGDDGTTDIGNTLKITGNTGFSGPMVVQGGYLQIGDGISGSVGSGSISLGMTAGLQLWPGSGAAPFSNVVSGSGSVTIKGGIVTLSGTNAYSGSTTVNSGGKLILSNAKALGTSQAVTVDSGGVLDLNGTPSSAPSLNIAGSGNGTLDFAALVNNNTTQFAAVSGDVLLLNGYDEQGALLNKVTIGGAGTLTLSGSIQQDPNSPVLLTVGGSGSVIVTGSFAGDKIPLELSSNASLVFNRAGTLTLSNVLTGAGALKVQAGSLVLAGTSSAFAGSVTVLGGTLSAGSGKLSTVKSLDVSGGLLGVVDYNSAASLTVTGTGRAAVSGTGLNLTGAVSNTNASANSLLFSGTSGTITLSALTGGGSTRFASNLSLGGTLFSGSVSVAGSAIASGMSGGSLTVGSSASLSSVAGGTLTVGGSVALGSVSGGVLNLNGSVTNLGTLNGGALNLGALQTLYVTSGSSNGLISGLGGLTKTGASTLTLAAANTFTGTTTVSGGTLAFVGSGGLVGPLVNNGGLIFNSTTNSSVGGILSGAGSLLKQNTNTVLITAGSGFTGATTITGGTLSMAGVSGNNLSQNISLSTGSTFNFSSGTYVFNGTISGSGTTLLSGTAQAPLVLTLGAKGSLGQTVKIGQYASLTLSTGAAFNGNVEVNNGGALNLSPGFTSSTARLTMNAGGLVTLAGGTSAQVSAVIQNGGVFLSSGSGQATLYSSGTFLVAVSDTTAPVLTLPANVTAQATSVSGATVTYPAATATDNVTASPLLAYSKASGAVFALGRTVVTVTATDGASNVSSGTFTVTVSDTTPPVLTLPANVTASATSASGAPVSYSAATATDNVTASPVLAYSKASGTVFALGRTAVTVTATDGASNVSSGTFTVTVSDTTAPVLTLPANVTAQATSASGAPVTYAAATATDNVTLSPVLTYSKATGTVFPLGTTAVTVTATDGASNVSSGTFTVTVSDTTAPVLSLPSNVTASATSASGALVTYPAATATDNVTANPVIAYSKASGAGFALGRTVVTVTATDAASNVSSGTFTVTVSDTTAPVLTLPSNVTTAATSASGAVVTYPAATATDDVTANPVIAYSKASGTVFPQGTTAVTVTATDAASNVSSGTFTVTVSDTLAPVLTLPSNVTAQATSAVGALVNYAAATATDNVTLSPVLTYSKASGTVFPLGTSAVTVTATDAASNVSSGTFTVTVSDTTPPVLTLPANVAASATSASGAPVTYPVATATDSVTVIPVLSYSKASGTVFALGRTVVTVTATDAASNVSSGTFTVTVSDTTAPVLTLPANVTASATSASGASVTYPVATATDNVTASPVLGYSKASGTVFALGRTVVTVTATDAASNVSSGTFTVTVSDTTAPVLTLPANVTVSAPGANGVSVTYPAATATDNVTASPALAYSKASGTVFPLGTTFVTVTATDTAGNVSTGTFSVTVAGLPVITKQPVGTTVNLGSSAVFSVEVTGSPATYQWRKNNVNIEGATAAAYSIAGVKPADAGTYSVLVSGAGGDVASQSATLSVNAKLPTVVSGAINQQILIPSDPLGYRVSNLPSGVAFSAPTGALSGSPIQAGTYAVSITGNSPGADPLNFEINVAALDPGLVGAFQGWVERDVTLNKNLGSTLQLTTTSRGAYSGKLVTGATAIALRGSLIASPASSNSAQTARILFVLPKTGFTLDVSLDSSGNLLSGTLSDGSSNTVSFEGWRNVWPTTPGNAAAYKGLHTFYLQQSDAADESLPQGNGFGSLQVSLKTGITVITTSLSDGAKMSGSTFIGPNGEVFLYGSLYTNLGSVVGRLDVDSDNNISGNPTWLRPNLSTKSDLTYRAGFGPIELAVNGGLYVPPMKGELILGLSPGEENAQLALTSGGLPDDIYQPFTVTSPGVSSALNRVTVPVNSNQLRVSSLSVSTGAFSGNFVVPGVTAGVAVRKANFYGLLVQYPVGVFNGYGYFLLPQLPTAGQTATTAPKLSGSLLLSAP